MVLADTTGTLIHATIKKQQVNKFQRLITTGEWRTVENFTVAKSTGKYRPTRLPFKMTLMNTTAISRIPSISEEFYFDFANFPDILNVNGLNENILIDVLGQVVSLGEMTTHDVNNKATKRFEFELRDTKFVIYLLYYFFQTTVYFLIQNLSFIYYSDERLTCTLWGRFAERMWDACQNGGNERVICLIRLAKIGSFKGILFWIIYIWMLNMFITLLDITNILQIQ
ncbi:uncharacterized protein LOC9322266 [Arabidopsis lyrata subsp. lyrata]|nr:uncharacterized protein LOC9322266 [Arabidopsis lyrata subsp. lyrata]|eukprot:XP_020887591.1 uncharacterized protein LOC9322266 [Arabidopsis lyrata subsp. lyrata]